jgi:glucose-1-phosphate thymidylyltransferase
VIRQEALDEDLLVAAGDSIFSEGGLDGLVRVGLERNAPVIAVSDVGDPEAIRSYSAITTDSDGRIVAFEEKPAEPESTLAGIALYFYPRSVLPLIDRYLAEGNNADQPGWLVEWMYQRTPFYAWEVPGSWLDIGSPETLERADRELSG